MKQPASRSASRSEVSPSVTPLSNGVFLPEIVLFLDQHATMGKDSKRLILRSLRSESHTTTPHVLYRVCYQDELRDACSSVGGSVWNSNYCIIDDYYTVVGPACWRGACFSGAMKNACADELGGVSVADRWCLIRGCDRTGTSSKVDRQTNVSQYTYYPLLSKWLAPPALLFLTTFRTSAMKRKQERCVAESGEY